MSRRSYDASRRRTAAAQNQARVVEAATRLMVARGYASTTIADVAETAGVSVPLVYAAFGNKAGLLKRVLDATIVGDADPIALRDRPEVAEVRAARSARRQCALTARVIAGVQARMAEFFAVLRDAAGTDPEVAVLVARQDDGRRAGMGEFVSVLSASGHLCTGLDPERAADAVWALTDPAMYHRLVAQRGWTREEYEQWLGDAIYNAVSARTTRR